VTRFLVWLVRGLVAGGGVIVAWDAVGGAHGDALIPQARAAADERIANADRFGVGVLGRVEPAWAIRRVGPLGTLTMNRDDRRLVREGDDVAAGQLLAEFADVPIKDAAPQQAEATVAQVQADAALNRVADRVLTLEDGRIRPQNPSERDPSRALVDGPAT